MSVFEVFLPPDFGLRPGDVLFSAFSTCRLDMQPADGNVVLSVLDDHRTDFSNFDRFRAPYRPIWEAGMGGKHAVIFIMQKDGNLVGYDDDNRPIFASNTQGIRNQLAKLMCQVDGNLVIWDETRTRVLWTSNTAAGMR